jgi:hypothetical protein
MQHFRKRTDRSQWRAQFVRDGRNEVIFHAVQFAQALVGLSQFGWLPPPAPVLASSSGCRREPGSPRQEYRAPHPGPGPPPAPPKRPSPGRWPNQSPRPAPDSANCTKSASAGKLRQSTAPRPSPGINRQLLLGAKSARENVRATPTNSSTEALPRHRRASASRGSWRKTSTKRSA